MPTLRSIAFHNWQKYSIAFAIIAATALVAYSNTFKVPFVFDDIHSIVESRARRHQNWGWRSWIGTRTLPSKTLDLNFKFNNLDVAGYHVVNLAIHIVAGWGAFVLIYGLARQSLPRNDWRLVGITVDNWSVVALIGALLFVAHPIQTQAVTYIVQRLASMATMFYLWALAAYVNYRQTSGRYRQLSWGAVSVACTIAAMHSKEISVTIPIAIVLLEFIFFSRQLKHFARQLPRLAPWLLTILIIPFYLSGMSEVIKEGWLQDSGQSSVEYALSKVIPITAETRDISRGVYLLTQFHVLKTYVRLLVWPVNQNLDYDYPLANSLWDLGTLGSLGLILLILAAGWWLWRKGWYLSAFGIAIFFLGQSVESSIIPIKDVIFEHRIYFSFIGFSLLASEAIGRLLVILRGRRWHRINFSTVWLAAIICILCVLIGATWRRNAVWGSELSLWSDVARKSPNKSRSYNNIGVAYMKQRDFAKAEENYFKELALDQNSVSAHVNLGSIYGQQKKYEQAKEHLQKAIDLNPSSASAFNNMGNILRETNDLSGAEQAYRRSLAISAEDADTWYNLGLVYINQKRMSEAVDALNHAIELKPEHADWHNKLGASLAMQGDYQKGEEHLREAIRLDPRLAPAYSNLGNVVAARGDNMEAAQWYARYLAMNPNDPTVLTSLADALSRLGAKEQARQAYQKALRLQPEMERAKAGINMLMGGQ